VLDFNIWGGTNLGDKVVDEFDNLKGLDFYTGKQQILNFNDMVLGFHTLLTTVWNDQLPDLIE